MSLKEPGFFKSYEQHVGYIIKNKTNEYRAIRKRNTSFKNSIFDIVCYEYDSHQWMLPYRDKYDVIDDLSGAVVMPTLSMLCSVASLSLALWELSLSIGIRFKLFDGASSQKAMDNAIEAGLFALACTAFSMMRAVQSIVSLVIRPIMTMQKGWTIDLNNRFEEDETPTFFEFIEQLG